jgi:hypothetical protein
MFFRRYCKFAVLMLLSTVLFSCTLPNNKTQATENDGTVNKPKEDETLYNEVQQDSSNSVLTSVGYAAIAAQKGDSFDLQMLNAIKVSKLEAYKELTEQLYGVLVSAENNVNGSRMQDDFIKSRVKGLVRGAKVLRSYHKGELYITELELDMQSSPFF